MNLQLFIVILIGIITGIILLRQIYRFFFTQKDTPRCGGCTLCALPDLKKETGESLPRSR